MLPDTMPTPRGVDAVLVDMDDTVFDHSLTCRAAIASLRSTYGYLRHLPLDQLWRTYLELLQGDFARIRSYVGQPGLTVDQARTERWRLVALRCGKELSVAEATALSQAYRGRYQRSRRAVPGARELLRSLHGRVKVVVVTNNEVAEQEEKVQFLGIGDRIDGLVVSEAVGVAKPDPRIFAAALDVAGAAADRAVMLGDSWMSDVLGARGAGIRAVWFNRFHLARPGPEAVGELESFRPLGRARELVLGRAGAEDTTPPPSLPSEL